MKLYAMILFLLCVSLPCLAQDSTGTLIILSDKVGPTIDLQERSFFRLFMSIQHFDSAVLFLNADSSYSFRVRIQDTSCVSSKIRWIPCTEMEIVRIRDHLAHFTASNVEAQQNADSIITKITMTVDALLLPAFGLFRIGFFYANVGLEPSYCIDPEVLSLNLVFASQINDNSRQLLPFLTFGCGKIFSYRCGHAPHQTMMNFGLGCKGRLKSLGIRLEWIGFWDFHKGGYFGPALSLSFFQKF